MKFAVLPVLCHNKSTVPEFVYKPMQTQQELEQFIAAVDIATAPLPEEHFDYIDSLNEVENSVRAMGKFAGSSIVGRAKAEIIAQQNEKLSKYDELTGLLNRRGIEESLQKMLARGHDVGIFVLDADNFKLVNDTYGHNKGDEVLKSIGELLGITLRKTDLMGHDIGRNGGDEFMVALDLTPTESQERGKKELTPEERLVSISTRVKKAFQEYVDERPDLEKIGFHVSIGAALYTPGMYIDQVIKDADSAMYEQKRNGTIAT